MLCSGTRGACGNYSSEETVWPSGNWRPAGEGACWASKWYDQGPGEGGTLWGLRKRRIGLVEWVKKEVVETGRLKQTLSNDCVSVLHTLHMSHDLPIQFCSYLSCFSEVILKVHHIVHYYIILKANSQSESPFHHDSQFNSFLQRLINVLLQNIYSASAYIYLYLCQYWKKIDLYAVHLKLT